MDCNIIIHFVINHDLILDKKESLYTLTPAIFLC